MFKKRQVILAALVVALGLAVYLNWQFSDAGKDLTASISDSSKNYGDSIYVNKDQSKDTSGASKEVLSPNVNDPNYFEQARANRESTREEALDIIKDVFNSVGADEATVAEAVSASSNIALAVELEGRAENLIKAKGFEDCMVYINGDTAQVVVKSDGIKDNQAIQIKEIIANTAKISVKNISIVPVK